MSVKMRNESCNCLCYDVKLALRSKTCEMPGKSKSCVFFETLCGFVLSLLRLKLLWPSNKIIEPTEQGERQLAGFRALQNGYGPLTSLRPERVVQASRGLSKL
jgi:hypothetical protein